MRAHLDQVAGDRPVASTSLPVRGLEIGRDATADLRVESERVSRRHARIHGEGGRHVLSDLESANGTFLNGRPVHGPVPLRHGDEIDLAGEITFVYRVDSARPLHWLAALAVVLLVAAGAWWISEQLRRRPDPVWVGAVALARQGIAAERAGDPSIARSKLKSAAGLLYKNGKLDDFERARVMTVAMQRIDERLDQDVDLPALYERVLEASRPAEPGAAGMERGAGCPLDQVDATRIHACIEAQVHWLFAALRQPTDEIPDDFYASVGRRLLRERGFIQRALQRGAPIIPQLEGALVAKKMPPLLHYVALIESGYRSDARSDRGAVGLWQLMRPTARDYGLEVSGSVDERKDLTRSSDAAAHYLQNLLFEFGSDALLLALAGYNLGQGQVRGKLKQLDDPFSDRSYWRLVETGLLPEETATYVTRFVAAAIAGEGGVPSESTLVAAGF
jgi:hypothetical protein